MHTLRFQIVKLQSFHTIINMAIEKQRVIKRKHNFLLCKTMKKQIKSKVQKTFEGLLDRATDSINMHL